MLTSKLNLVCTERALIQKEKRNPSPRLNIQNKNVCLATAWLNSKLLHVLLFMHTTCNLDVPRQEKNIFVLPLKVFKLQICQNL